MPLMGGGNITLLLTRNILQTNSDTCKFNTYMTSAEGELLLFITQSIYFDCVYSFLITQKSEK